MRKTMLGSLTGLLIPFAAYAAPVTYGAYQRKLLSRGASSSILHSSLPLSLRVKSPKTIEAERLSISPGSLVRELIILDEAVRDKHLIFKQIQPGVDIVEIKSGSDGVASLISALAGHRNLDAVHIVAHAEAGSIYLGGHKIDQQKLMENVSGFAAINHAILEGGDLMIYGCDLAQGEKGEAFLEILQQNTHADIAASNDKTGNADFGGDWDLEIRKGDIETPLLADSLALKDFTGVLQFSGNIDFSQDKACGTYGGAASVNAEVWTSAAQQYALVVDGANFSTDLYDTANALPCEYGDPDYDPAHVRAYTFVNETQLTLRFLNNDIFSPQSLRLENIHSGAHNFAVTSSKGDNLNLSFAAGETKIVDLSAFSKNITSITISSDRVYATVDDFQALSVGAYLNTNPTDIALSASSISATSTVAGANVGVLSTTDIDVTDTHTYSLVNNGASSVGSCGAAGDDHNASFQIDNVNDQLETAGHLSAGTYRVCVQTHDGTGSYQETFTVTVTAGTDGTLIAAPGVTEPVHLDTTINDDTEAVNVFDFNLDETATDGFALTISGLFLNVSGTSTDTERGQIIWHLNGPDASNVAGTYSAAQDRIVFSGLSISIADGADETYTVNAYYNTNTGLVDGHTVVLSVDGDTNLTVGGAGTQMGSTSAITNGSGTQITVVATQLVFATQPAGSVSGSALTTQPVVAARDAFGNTDVDFTETVTLTEASAGSLSNSTQAASSGVATFTNLSYTATADQQGFTLTANDQDGVGSNLPTVDSNSVTSNVVATKLLFTTQPVPTLINSGVATSFTTVPVVSATDAGNIVDTGYSTSIVLSVTDPNDGTVDGTVNSLTGTGDTDGSGTTVTLTPSSGAATYTGLQLTYTASGGSNTIALRGTSGGLTAANSGNITAAATPVVTAGNISISGASGTGGAYKIGDTVTATWNNTAGGDNNAGITGVTVDFSPFGGGTAVAATNSSNTWTATYTIVAGAIDATNRNVSVTATNASGNTTTADNANATVDNIRPTAGIVVSDTALAAGETSLVTITFNEAVTAFTNADLTIANGSLSAVSSSDGGITWTATLTPTASIADATNLITLDNTGVQDDAGNAGAGTTDSNNYAIDTARPTAGIVVSDTALAAGETSLVTITFSEAVTGFTNADLTIANGSLSAVSSSDGGITWTATLTPTASINDATNVITLANTGVQDAAGNAGTGTTNSNNYAIDTARPTASIVVADAALAAGETSLVTITFSEAVAGFTNADLTIANGSLSAVSSSDGGITWTATFTPTASITDATNVITLANTGVQNAAGNAGTGTTDSNNYAIDTARPTAGIVVSDTALAAGETSLVTITFSEAVTGFANADLTIANGTLSAVSSSDGGITWTATLTPTASITDATNVITLDNTGVQDAAGNAGTGTTDSNNYAIDTARPTASIVVADTALTAGETSLVTITFSEAVTGFANADLTIANGTLSAVSSSDGGITWTATLTPTADITDATNVITLANTGVQDAAGNAGTGTTDSNNYAIDTARPTAGIVVSDTTLASGETSPVTITFSEAITGFTNADLTIANGTLSAVITSDGGITWTAALTPTAGITDATNVITLVNTGVQDAAGNTGTGTTDSNNYVIDTQAPTSSSVSLPSNDTYAEGDNLDFTVNFGEAVTVDTAGGTPRLELTVGLATRNANYHGGSSTSALLFRYTVQAGDNDSDGIAFSSTTINTSGGTMRDSIGNNASTNLGSIGSLAAVLVDTQAPAVATNTGLTVTEDETGTISDARLAATDNISSAANIVYTVVAIPANGTLLLSGGALSNGNTFTQDDIDNDRVTYDHDGGATDSDSFTFNVRDAVDNIAANDIFDFTISPPEEPVITAPADLDIDATGLYTTVTLRQLLGLAADASNDAVQAARLALATDVADGVDCCNPVALELDNGRIRLAPGAHLITWRATDSDSNTAEDTQQVNIHPLVSFAKDQIGVEGGQVSLRIILNGESPVDPLMVPYEIDTVESSAGGADHDLVDGELEFNAGETEQTLNINLADGDGAEGDEVLAVRLGTGINAGATDSHRITITEGNIAPTVVLSLEQNGVDTALVTPTDGMVTVMAMFDDANGDVPGDYDWSLSDAELIDTDGDTADGIFEFDPSLLNVGVLRLHVAVGDGTATTTAVLYFRVVAELPNLGTGTGDADGDGIPDYLDEIDAINVLPETAAQTDAYLIECDPGVRCGLGRHALLGSGGGARLTAAQLSAQDIAADADYEHSGGVFDFQAHALPVAGQSLRVAIPLQEAIPMDAVYRKFDNGQWTTFVEDADNALHSAQGERGYCPPPGDAAWRSGLREGYYCIQLTLEDGGPNDTDGEANGSIEDPGSVATQAADLVVYGIRSKVKGGTGSLDAFFLIALTLLVVLRGRRIGRSRAGGLLLLLAPVQSHALDWDALLANASIELGFFRAESSRSRGEFIDRLAADGVAAEVQAYDVSRTAYQVSVGYEYRERLALRLGYLDLRDVKVDLTASAASDEVLSSAFSRHYPVSANGLVLAHRYEYPLSERFRLAADAGLYVWDSKISLTDLNGRDIDMDIGGDTDPILGLGANYRITDRYAAGLIWQRVFFSGQEADLWGLSAVRHF